MTTRKNCYKIYKNGKKLLFVSLITGASFGVLINISNDVKANNNQFVAPLLNPKVNVSTNADPNVSVSTSTDPKVNVSTNADPNVSVSTSTDPKVTVSTNADPNVSVSTSTDPKVTVSTSKDSNVSVSTSTDPKVTVSTSTDPKVTVSTNADPNVSVSTSTDPKVTVSTSTDPKVTVSTSTDPNVSVSTNLNAFPINNQNVNAFSNTNQPAPTDNPIYDNNNSDKDNQSKVLNKINDSINNADWEAVDSDKLSKYVFLRNDERYVININAPENSSNLMVANHIIDTNTGTNNTYSYYDGSARTSTFGYIKDNEDIKKISGENDGNYYVSSSLKDVLVRNEFENSIKNLKVTEHVLINESGYIVHKISFENISDHQLPERQYFALLDTMLNSNDYIPIFKDNHDGAFISNNDIVLYTNLLSNGYSAALDWRQRNNLSSDVLIDTNIKSPFIENPLLNEKFQAVKADVDTAIRYVTPSISLLPEQSIDLVFTESVFSKNEIETIKKNGGDTNFLDYFIDKFKETYNPTIDDSDISSVYDDVLKQENDNYKDVRDKVEKANKIQKKVNDSNYKSSKFKEPFKEIDKKSVVLKISGFKIVDDTMTFCKENGITNTETELEKKSKPALNAVEKIDKYSTVLNSMTTISDDINGAIEIEKGTSPEQKEYKSDKNVIKNKKYKNDNKKLDDDAWIFAVMHKLYESILSAVSDAGNLVTKFISAVLAGPIGIIGGVIIGTLASFLLLKGGEWLWENQIKDRIKKWLSKLK